MQEPAAAKEQPDAPSTPKTSRDSPEMSHRRSRSARIRVRVLMLAVAIAGLAVGGMVLRMRSPASLQALAREIQGAVRTGEWSQLRKQLGAVPWGSKSSGSDAFRMAERALLGGRTDAALAALEQIPDSDPLAARARLLAGQLERQRSHARQAEAMLLEAVRLNPRLVQARRELAFLYGIQGRRDDLNAQFKTLARLIPLDLNAVFLWTNSSEEILDNVANRPALEGFLTADPEDRWSRLALARVFLNSEELDACERVLEPLPLSDHEALALRARLELKRARVGELEKLLELGPRDHPILARLRGLWAMQRKDLPTAIEQFQTAVRLDPTNREATEGLARALLASGRLREGDLYQKQAQRLRVLADLLAEQFENLQRGRRDPTLPRRLGFACEDVGRVDEAQACFRLALEIDPADAEVLRALDRLHPRGETDPRRRG